jgi:hypothetical protein
MPNKRIARPGEERRAKELLDRIAQKKAARIKPPREESSQGTIRQITERPQP